MSKKQYSLQETKRYLKSLPQKRIASAMIILNSNNELLMLKRTYKDRWTLPGGVVEKDESPLDGCIRETFEEIGLKLHPKHILFTRYVNKPELKDEFIGMYYFYGKINKNQIKSIKLAEGEIEKYIFVKIDDVGKYNKAFATTIAKYKTDFIKGKPIGYLESKNEKIA